MTTLEKVNYTALHRARVRPGRLRAERRRQVRRQAGPARGGPVSNPEQMFAAGCGGCFIDALGVAAGKMKLGLLADVSIDAEVDLGPIPNAFGIAARLRFSLPSIEREQARKRVEAAHLVCPYSNATRANTDLRLSLA
jgi:Ohr subfamily peroxiredoxin